MLSSDQSPLLSWRPHRVVPAALLLLALMLGPALAAETAPALPLFATLRAEVVNLRTGPGEQYPIEWVYTRKGLPVEVVARYDVWRKIRDSQGSEGWVHQRMIATSRAVIVRGETRALHAGPDPNSRLVARVEPEVIAKLLECEGPWCRIETQEIKGWLRRSEVWGVFPEEEVR